eukprot:14955271-Heterocapsa_arctica.AAC.1
MKSHRTYAQIDVLAKGKEIEARVYTKGESHELTMVEVRPSVACIVPNTSVGGLLHAETKRKRRGKRRTPFA